jgi:uncharacterized membrane protein
MTRIEYLAELDKYLKRLPQVDYEEAMDYFVEYFEEAGPENEETVIAELGTPKEAASDVISTVLGKHVTEPNKTPKTNATIIGMIVLSIFAAPIALPVLIFLILLMLAIVALVLSAIIAAYLLGLAGLVLSAMTLFESFTILTSSLSAVAMGIGASLMLFGGSILVWMVTTFLARFSGKGLVLLWQKMIRKVRTV